MEKNKHGLNSNIIGKPNKLIHGYLTIYLVDNKIVNKRLKIKRELKVLGKRLVNKFAKVII